MPFTVTTKANLNTSYFVFKIQVDLIANKKLWLAQHFRASHNYLCAI